MAAVFLQPRPGKLSGAAATEEQLETRAKLHILEKPRGMGRPGLGEPVHGWLPGDRANGRNRGFSDSTSRRASEPTQRKN